MLFRLLPVCVMKVFLLVNGLQSHKPSKYTLQRVKLLTQKRPVYAAPERLVGDFSFYICFFREPHDVMRFPEPKWTNPLLTHQDPLVSLSNAVGGHLAYIFN